MRVNYLKNLRNLLLIGSVICLPGSTIAQNADVVGLDHVVQDIPRFDPPITRAVNLEIGEGGNNTGFDMAPETTPKVVAAAVAHIKNKMPKGPFKPTWISLTDNYHVPEWFIGAKFGIFLHWGLYSVPAHQSEWYEKHMYGNAGVAAWHAAHYGDPAHFGYKDFIPLFTQKHFRANQWAALFKRAGARFVIPTAQHHDNFALWDSKVTPYNAVKMGPKRDLIGELAAAVRKEGLKFGVSNHGIENFQFINPPDSLTKRLKAAKADLFDPQWKKFYHVADRSSLACQQFLVNWYERNVELIDQYKPDMLWFDNGIDQRYLDPLKLEVAAYYYNRAKSWGKEVSISAKKAAYAPAGTNINTIGSILDFEGKVPPGIRTGVWQVDTKIGSSWGYTENMKISSAASILNKLIEVVSKNGTLLLNLSPTADGRIPEDQQQVLLSIGDWLNQNGQAIYDTHSWIRFSDKSGNTRINYTVKKDTLFAILTGTWPQEAITIASIKPGKLKGSVKEVTLLGRKAPLRFSQSENGLKVYLPADAPSNPASVLKITGLKMNPSTATKSGNPNFAGPVKADQ